MSKTVCYTCITGGYDTLHDPLNPSADIDYICFTDSADTMVSVVWKFRQIPAELNHLSNVLKQRAIKICPHRYLSEYDVSVWVDGNITIIGDLNKFISQYDLAKSSFYTRIHPTRNCIYDEAKACIAFGKDRPSIIDAQMSRYQEDGYPYNLGLAETCVLLRAHTDIHCAILGNYWMTELLGGSYRDQLSFNYVCWKHHFIPGYLTSELHINNQYFKINNHG